MKRLLALNIDLSTVASDGEPPEWIELIPAGPTVVGRDGRRWLFDDAACTELLADFQARRIPVVIDYEHSTQLKAPKGEEAPAACWINALQNRNGALWGRAEWTVRGAKVVREKEYRFLSPVFDYYSETMRIARLVSAGLTNKPNLMLTALNQETTPLEAPVDEILKALLELLGLPADATPEQAIDAVTKLKTKAEQAPETGQAQNHENDLTRFVPRADYDATLKRATNAEQTLASFQKAEQDKAVETAITSALAAGKITPATADYHRAACHEKGGLERFQAFVQAAPTVGGPSGLDNKSPEKTRTALNAEEMAVCQQLGVDPVEFAKNKPSEG